jgi:hypothetical protein
MVEDGLYESIAENQKSLEGVTRGFVMGNMILNLFLSASLNQLWVFMNALQIIVCLPLLNVRFP